jgi:hypothetical protein
MLSDKLKQLTYERANRLCEYCKSPANISSQPFVVEHIFPKSKGGESIQENTALSCQGCNNYKYNKTTGIDGLTGKEAALFNPRKQNWSAHFAWSNDTTEIIGLTTTGRVTSDVLKLNRIELRNLRRLLTNAGKHPPEIDE